MTLTEKIQKVSKAVAGAVSAGAAAVGAALLPASAPGITAAEWATIIGAVVGGFLLTWASPANKV